MSLAMVICTATFGACTGAFLPRVAARLAVPAGRPPRSTCAHCSKPFPPGKTGWVRVGRSSDCESVPWHTPAVGATTAALLGPSLLLPGAVLGILLAMIDMRCLRLPDRLVAALAFVTVLPLCTLGAPDQITRGLTAAAGSCLTYGILALLPRAGLGFGDVKLATVLGFVLAFHNWPALVVGVVAPHLINGPIALWLLIRRRATRHDALPFGPALLAGALIGLCCAS